MKATPYVLYAFRTFDVLAINRETSRIYSNKMGFQYIPNVSSDVKYIRLIRRSNFQCFAGILFKQDGTFIFKAFVSVYCYSKVDSTLY